MCITTYYLLNFYIIFAKKMNISSIPNERSSHELILPRGAGIVFGIVFLIFTLPSIIYFKSELSFYLPFLFCGFTSLALGFFDDSYDMNSIVKLFMQFIIISFMFYFAYRINFNNYDEVILYILLVTSFVWFLNSVNFVDGIDGIISSLSLIISLSMVFIIFMNNEEKGQKKDISSFEFDKDNNLNDYKFLVQKLKNIKDSIQYLEKIFFDKEI